MPLTRRRALALPSLILALGLAGCEPVTGPASDLDEARARWAARGPDDYTMRLTRGCFCTEEGRGPVVIAVRGGVVQSRRYVSTGADVPPSLAGDFPSVEALFAHIEAAQRAGANELRVTYHPTLGHPVDVYVDPHAGIADDEHHFTVADVAAAPQ